MHRTDSAQRRELLHRGASASRESSHRRWMRVLVRYAGDAEPLERQPDRHPVPV